MINWTIILILYLKYFIMHRFWNQGICFYISTYLKTFYDPLSSSELFNWVVWNNYLVWFLGACFSDHNYHARKNRFEREMSAILVLSALIFHNTYNSLVSVTPILHWQVYNHSVWCCHQVGAAETHILLPCFCRVTRWIVKL